MGSHVWEEKCPCCGFEEMIVIAHDSMHFEIACPICGYEAWTEEKMPDNSDIELARFKLTHMSAEEKDEIMRLWYEDRISLVARLRNSV